MSADLTSLVTSLAQRARSASLVLATTPVAAKNAALAHLADLIDASHSALLTANLQDLATPEATALTALDRRVKELEAENARVAALNDEQAAIIVDQRLEILRLREALAPSGDTKASYMGEFSFSLTRTGECGDEYSEKVYVPWTTIKEIMAAILARAALGGSDDQA